MLAALDIGNTNIVLALHDGEGWTKSWRLATDERKTSDEYFAVLRSLLDGEGVDRSLVDRTAISSVVPNLTISGVKNMRRLFGAEPLVVGRSVESGLVKESIPVELGSDLLCNLAWAHHVHPGKHVMTIDFGTALTFSTVDGEGRVLGVAIAPGLLTAARSLYGATAQLPQVELTVPKSALGRDSQGSIRAGIMFGWAGLVKEMVARTEEEIGSKLVVMATGGLCQTISPLIPGIDSLDKYHTLNGLRLIRSLNG